MVTGQQLGALALGTLALEHMTPLSRTPDGEPISEYLVCKSVGSSSHVPTAVLLPLRLPTVPSTLSVSCRAGQHPAHTRCT